MIHLPVNNKRLFKRDFLERSRQVPICCKGRYRVYLLYLGILLIQIISKGCFLALHQHLSFYTHLCANIFLIT